VADRLIVSGSWAVRTPGSGEFPLPYSAWWPISARLVSLRSQRSDTRAPGALFGLVAYFSAFSFATFAAFGYARARIFLIPTIGAMFLGTLWLLYVQAFLLHAYCRFCLFSAATTFLLAGLVIALPAGRDRSIS